MSTNNNVKPQNRGLKSRLVLGGLALLGVGAVFTAAAWTTSAQFTQEATSGGVSFEVSVDGGTTWAESESGVFEIPVNLAGLEEGDTRTSDTVLLRNGGSSGQLQITGAEVEATGTIFEGAAPATASFGTMSQGALEVNGFTPDYTYTDGLVDGILEIADGSTHWGIGYEVVVATPADWPTSYADSTGEVNVTITVSQSNGRG